MPAPIRAHPEPPPAPPERWPWLVLTRERLAALWAQLQDFPAALRLMRVDSDAAFTDLLMDPANLFIDVGPGVGLLAALDVEPGHDARLVFVGFDHHLATHRDAFAGGLAHIMALAQLRRVTAYTPADLPVVVKLLSRLGFQWEGVLREGWAPGVDLQVNGLVAGKVLG